MNVEDLRSHIRTIPHFPKQGVMFKDITTLLKNPEAFQKAVDEMLRPFEGKRIDKVVAAESRGFIFGSVIAHRLGVGFVPLRKPGKLPHKTIRQDFETEYSKDAFEIHEDAIEPGENVLIVDDLIATGGTLEAAVKLVERLGGNVVGIVSLIELGFLGGRKRLDGYEVHSIIKYESEE